MAKVTKYSLIGVDGNAYAIMGYTARAMRETGFTEEEVSAMYDKATSGYYYNLITVCNGYVEQANARLEKGGKK